MSYFVGKNLARKIKEFGFEQLDDILGDFGETGLWQDMEISVDGEVLEPARIVVYSILHAHGLKDEFTVKMQATRRVLEVKRKIDPNVSSRLIFKDSQTTGFVKEEITSYDPGMKKRIFDDSDTL